MEQDLPLRHGKQGAWPVTKQKQTKQTNQEYIHKMVY